MIPDTEENHAWNHILEGRYDAAIAIYERILPPTVRLGEWNNYGTALLLSGPAEAAEQAYRHARELPMGRWVVNLKVGAALWCQGAHSDEIGIWHTFGDACSPP